MTHISASILTASAARAARLGASVRSGSATTTITTTIITALAGGSG